ncbi:MAG: leucine efflux protein LeuE [Sutterellaceae bacterium]|nr:leucine efflux protein LeuE [Sutterellaceae bacterium]
MLTGLGVHDLWVYVVGAFVIIVIPGPNSLYVLRTAIVRGRKPAFAASLAILVGDYLLMFCSYIGVAAALAANPALFDLIRYAGGAYLGYLGLKVLWNTFCVKTDGTKEGSHITADEKLKAAADKSEMMKAFRTALALSLTNPKAILFFVAFFVQFIDPNYQPAWVPYSILAVILQTFSITWLLFLITVGADLLRMVARFPLMGKLGNTAIGSVFLLFAAKVALDSDAL